MFDLWVGKIPWRKGWQPIPVFLPGESHGQEEPDGLQSIGSQRVGHHLACTQIWLVHSKSLTFLQVKMSYYSKVFVFHPVQIFQDMIFNKTWVCVYVRVCGVSV